MKMIYEQKLKLYHNYICYFVFDIDNVLLVLVSKFTKTVSPNFFYIHIIHYKVITDLPICVI